VEVEVVDDGVGAASVDGDGKGLIGMRERVAFFGGDFRAGPRAAGGYAVWARFPFPSE
jgi:signal transduction histidine kinase